MSSNIKPEIMLMSKTVRRLTFVRSSLVLIFKIQHSRVRMQSNFVMKSSFVLSSGSLPKKNAKAKYKRNSYLNKQNIKLLDEFFFLNCLNMTGSLVYQST